MSVLDVKTFKKGQRSSGRNSASNLEKKSQNYSKRMTQIWNCIDVEMDQSESSIKRRVRELIFDNVYESEMALRQQNPIRVTANNIKVRNKKRLRNDVVTLNLKRLITFIRKTSMKLIYFSILLKVDLQDFSTWISYNK